METSKILYDIHSISKKITNDELNQLRIEEEMLLLLAKNPSTDMQTKVSALRVIKEINQKQLKILGG